MKNRKFETPTYVLLGLAALLVLLIGLNVTLYERFLRRKSTY